MASLEGTPAAYSIAFDSRSVSGVAHRLRPPAIANLSTRKIVTGSKSRRVFVQSRLAIPHGIVCKMGKAEEAGLLWLLLFFKIARVHCGRLQDQLRVQVLGNGSMK
jgi:hypothetical protein